MRGHQGIAGHLWAHLAIAQDEMREDREYRFARGALKTPDSDPTQTDAHVMRVACQASAAATGRLVFQLKTQRQDERQHQFHQGLAVAKQLKVGRFVLKIDGDRAVFAGLVGRVAHGSPLG
jgi:ParB-like chromosome segregation protein Spo0J